MTTSSVRTLLSKTQVQANAVTIDCVKTLEWPCVLGVVVEHTSMLLVIHPTPDPSATTHGDPTGVLALASSEPLCLPAA